MMTSFAFIFGLVPLVLASGAGAATQKAVAMSVFGGMIAASFIGIFVIPGLYVVFQTMREKAHALSARKPAAEERALKKPVPASAPSAADEPHST